MGQPGKTFVGFGFGPIQSGLFAYEAWRSGNFARLVVAEIDDALVGAVRAGGNRYAVNIARPDRIDRATVPGVELYNPRDARDRGAIVEAIAQADELATALPSVNVYGAGGSAAVVQLLREGLARRTGRAAVLYAAENHNHAAEILTEKLVQADANLAAFQAVNTVIGKMSGILGDAREIARLNLAPLTAGAGKAVLVEQFNRILIERIRLPGFRRGIEVFQEKPDLLPFEEAKLFGHNAIHATLAYLSEWRGLETIAQAADDARVMAVAREAFLGESGPALIRRHGRLGDDLFTDAGWRNYAEDLLERMVCPNLCDRVARVGRDHLRKLAYGDRLFGAMRLALSAGVTPRCLALGAAAGVVSLVRRQEELPDAPECLPRAVESLDRQSLEATLRALWAGQADEQAPRLIDLTAEALDQLREDRWE